MTPKDALQRNLEDITRFEINDTLRIDRRANLYLPGREPINIYRIYQAPGNLLEAAAQDVLGVHELEALADEEHPQYLNAATTAQLRLVGNTLLRERAGDAYTHHGRIDAWTLHEHAETNIQALQDHIPPGVAQLPADKYPIR